MFELNMVDANTIQIEAEKITDEKIWELEEIRERLNTFNIAQMSWFEYNYVPYYNIGTSNASRIISSINTNRFEDYNDLIDYLIKESKEDRSYGWSNELRKLNITCELEKEDESSNLDKKLDFIVNLLFNVYGHVDVHHKEVLGSKLAMAEHLGFDVTLAKEGDYDESSYNFWKNDEFLDLTMFISRLHTKMCEVHDKTPKSCYIAYKNDLYDLYKKMDSSIESFNKKELKK